MKVYREEEEEEGVQYYSFFSPILQTREFYVGAAPGVYKEKK
jgi:hypothetical protein